MHWAFQFTKVILKTFVGSHYALDEFPTCLRWFGYCAVMGTEFSENLTFQSSSEPCQSLLCIVPVCSWIVPCISWVPWWQECSFLLVEPSKIRTKSSSIQLNSAALMFTRIPFDFCNFFFLSYFGYSFSLLILENIWKPFLNVLLMQAAN